MGCILYELAMLRSPFKSEGLNLVGLFQKINKGDYQEIPDVYSEQLRGLVTRMISLTASHRPSMQEVWEFCRNRPSSAVLQERMRQHQNGLASTSSAGNGLDSRSTRARRNKDSSGPESETPSRPSSSDKQQESPPTSRPPSSEGNGSSAGEESTRRRHAEARMELLFERLKILRYELVLKKRIPRTHFASDSRALPRVTPQSRFDDMCLLSRWLLSLLGANVEENDNNEDSPIVTAQRLLLAAGKAGILGVAQISAPALTSGVGIEVCDLLNELSAAALQSGKSCTEPPDYPSEPIETLEPCDELDVTGDEGQQSNDSEGDSTASFAYEDGDFVSRWIVASEDNRHAILHGVDDKECDMIHSDIDPVAWEQERVRMLPKLRSSLQEKLRRRPAEASWRVRLDQVRTQGGIIIEDKTSTSQGVAHLQETRERQIDRLESHEKLVNSRYLRARRLYHEGTTRLSKARDEVQFIQENVNRATTEIARLQAARAQVDSELKAADARLTDNSMLVNLKRQVRRLTEENQEMSLKLQVLDDYWTRKQLHHQRPECSNDRFS